MTETPLTPGYSRLTLTNEPHAPALACAHVVQVARQLGFTHDEVSAIELGVEEATANVVRHAFAPGELGSFDIACLPTALGLEIRISDQGLPFDPTLLPDYDPDSMLSQDASVSPGGLGIFLMRQVFDGVTFRNLGKLGKETGLIKYRTHAPITDYTAANPVDSNQIIEPVTLVRRIKPTEAIEVSRCVYESYGYSYPYEHIYYPERITALNESGDIISAVAVTPSGHIAGHAALVKNDIGGAELAIVVTRLAYRGQGVARQLGEFLLGEAQAEGLQSIFTHAVTSHTFTQQFCQGLDFRDCALLPGHAPASLRFRNIADQLQQRESCLLAIRTLTSSRTDLPLYAPQDHQCIIKRLYDNLALTPQWSHTTQSGPSVPAQTIMSVNAATGLDLGMIQVDSWGNDCTSMLKQRLQQLRREHYAIVQLLLPLWQPACAHFLSEIEDAGFFFSGVFPQSSGQDWLVMHHILDTTIDYNRLHVHSPTAHLLLDYVKQLDTFNMTAA